MDPTQGHGRRGFTRQVSCQTQRDMSHQLITLPRTTKSVEHLGRWAMICKGEEIAGRASVAPSSKQSAKLLPSTLIYGSHPAAITKRTIGRQFNRVGHTGKERSRRTLLIYDMQAGLSSALPATTDRLIPIMYPLVAQMNNMRQRLPQAQGNAFWRLTQWTLLPESRLTKHQYQHLVATVLGAEGILILRSVTRSMQRRPPPVRIAKRLLVRDWPRHHSL